MGALVPPLEVFYSYADADESLRNELEKHLSLLWHEGLITTWHRQQITPGTDWTRDVDHHLDTASVILLLISSDFLASDYCYGMEMQRALRRHEAGQTRVIPILLRPVDNWQSAPFGKLRVLPGNGRPITDWRNRDAAFADIVQGIRAVFEDVQGLTVNASSALFPRLWNIPYPRNPVFTGREELLTRLADMLKTGQTTALSQPQAITGLGGIGKTQVAVEYAYRSYQHYQAVFWVRADTYESLVSGYADIAKLLSLPEKDQMIIVQAVMRWFTVHTEWLLILDNADDLTVVRAFLPSVFGGHILLTTRAQIMGRLAQRIEVDTMEQDIGVLLLVRRAGLVAHEALLEEISPSDRTAAREITEELGGLPLALDQAGAYIEESLCSLSDYQRLYRTHKAELLSKRGSFADDHPEPVATTWSLSFQKVEQKSSAAAELLRLCAFLAPDAIPEEIITEGAPDFVPDLQYIASNSLELNKAIRELRNFSLIGRNARLRLLSVHRLVQEVLKYSLSENEQRRWAEQAVRAVNRAFPDVKSETPLVIYQQYLPHVRLCADLIKQWDMKLPEAARLLLQLGNYLKMVNPPESQVMDEVELLFQWALTIQKDFFGPAHHVVADTLGNLAELYLLQKKYGETKSTYQQILVIYEQALEPGHPRIAAIFDSLGNLCLAQHVYVEAEQFYRRSLEIREDAHHERSEIVSSLDNLGNLYLLQKKYVQATPFYARALTICVDTLGVTHPSIKSRSDDLKVLYRNQGKYIKANTAGIAGLIKSRLSRRVALIGGIGLIGAGFTWRILTPSPLYVYRSHRQKVNAVAWAPDSQLIASASDDKTVQVWNASTGKLVSSYIGHTGPVYAVAWSPDGEEIASSSADGTVQIWDSATGEQIGNPFEAHGGSIYAVAWSPNSKLISSADENGKIFEWQAKTGRITYLNQEHVGPVYALAWSPNGKQIVSAGSDGIIRVWGAVYSLEYSGHRGEIRGVAWSPDGKWIASAGEDGTAQVWDAMTGETIYRYTNHQDEVYCVAWSPDSLRIASAGKDDTVQIWDATTGDNVRICSGSSKLYFSNIFLASWSDQLWVNNVSWSHDGKRIASSSTNTTVQVWSTS